MWRKAMRKTTVVIDDRLLEEAMEITGAASMKEAIETGLRMLVRQRNREELRRELGTFDLELTPKYLEALRDAD
jgi:Arc/MetJ family transcription regulator